MEYLRKIYYSPVEMITTLKLESMDLFFLPLFCFPILLLSRVSFLFEKERRVLLSLETMAPCTFVLFIRYAKSDSSGHSTVTEY